MNKTPPQTDREAWEKYPRLNWVYNTTQLLDQQRIDWSPFPTEERTHALPVFNVEGHFDRPFSNVYVRPLQGEVVSTVAAIAKGQMKWYRHHDHRNEVIEDGRGDLVMRITSFVIMHLKKHSGIVIFDTVGDVLVGVKLRPLKSLTLDLDEPINTLYRRSQWNQKSSSLISTDA